MATFIPNVTDVFPGSSEYNPDWNRIERMLRLRQKMYDDGASKVKTLYDSIFNSPMLRPSDIQRRDSYLKIISDNLNRVSATDLSLRANIDTANNLMLPITEDQNIIHDISYTKKGREQLSQAESLRTSNNADERKKYWDIGVKDINYQMEDYAKSSDSQALGMKSPVYVPQIDIQKIAEERFKKAGISAKEDIIDGRYIWTKKNGDLVFPIAEAYVNSIMQQDPAMKEMALAKARVERRDTAKAKALSDGISEEDAEILYITDKIQTYGSQLIKQNLSDKQDLAALEKKMESWEKTITTKGIIKGSKEHKQYLADLDALYTIKQGVKQSDDVGESIKTINFENIDEARSVSDALVASGQFSTEAKRIAAILSSKNMEVTVKAEPYELSRYRSSLNYEVQSAMESIRQVNRVDMLNKKEEALKRRPAKPTKKGQIEVPTGTQDSTGRKGIKIPKFKKP